MSTYVTEPLTARVAVFKNRQNQAVRIPKAMSYPDEVTELEMTRVGDVITLQPPRQSWDEFITRAEALNVPDDDPFWAYLEERHAVVEYRPAVFDDDEAGR